MKMKLLAVSVFIGLFFYWLPQPEPLENAEVADSVLEAATLNTDFVIRNVRLFDGQQAIESVDVLVKDNRIYRIGQNIENVQGYQQLDAAGLTLLPGLVDAHTHTWGSALAEALNFGVTTELDMFTQPASSRPHQKIRDNLSNNAQADLFSATILATAPKGHGTEYGFAIPVLESETQVEQFVIDRIEDGADYIKAVYLAAESERQFYPSISRAILAKLIQEAHRHNKLLVVHVDNLISAQHAIELGADGIIHSFMDKVVDKAFIDLMVTRKAFIIPTLSVQWSVTGLNNAQTAIDSPFINPFISIAQRQQLLAKFQDYGIPASAYARASQSVSLLAKAGVTILAGSDAPNPGTTHGVSIHQEMQLLVEAGLSPLEALHSATGAARKVFPIGQRGIIEVGAPASMLLVDGNPLVDIKVTQNIVAIWKNGVQFKRLKVAAELDQLPPLSATLISDFNQLLNKTTVGAGIEPTTDQYAGGRSEVSLSLVDKVGDSEDTALLVSGEIKDGFVYPWSGFAYLPGESITQGANLNSVKHLVFEAKGSEQLRALSVMVFQQGSFQPSSYAVTLTNDWQVYRVPFHSFKNVDFSRISNISFVATGVRGKFEFSIDNLNFE